MQKNSSQFNQSISFTRSIIKAKKDGKEIEMRSYCVGQQICKQLNIIY